MYLFYLYYNYLIYNIVESVEVVESFFLPTETVFYFHPVFTIRTKKSGKRSTTPTADWPAPGIYSLNGLIGIYIDIYTIIFLYHFIIKAHSLFNIACFFEFDTSFSTYFFHSLDPLPDVLKPF